MAKLLAPVLLATTRDARPWRSPALDGPLDQEGHVALPGAQASPCPTRSPSCRDRPVVGGGTEALTMRRLNQYLWATSRSVVEVLGRGTTTTGFHKRLPSAPGSRGAGNGRLRPWTPPSSARRGRPAGSGTGSTGLSGVLKAFSEPLPLAPWVGWAWGVSCGSCRQVEGGPQYLVTNGDVT